MAATMTPERLSLGELDRRVTRLENDTTARFETMLSRYNTALGILTSSAEQGQLIESLEYRISRLEQAAEEGHVFRRQLVVAMIGVMSVVLGTLLTVLFSVIVK